MKKAKRKDFFREIKRSRNRFLSILFIVALGTAFYAGIRSAEPDMRSSADAYYDQTNLMDIRVMGTMGMTDEDVEAISQIQGIEDAQGAYEAEVLYQDGETELVLQMFSLCDDLNQMTLKEGRLPESPDECFVDENFVEATGCQIGDTITVMSGTEDNIEDTLANTEFTITGYGNYSWYLSWDRGSASIGDGTLDAFVAVPRESFSQEVYTTVYARVADTEELLCYSDEYQEQVDAVMDQIEAIEGERCQIRLTEIKDEANAEIADAQKQVDDAEAELEDARQQLNDAEEELEDGRAELEDGEAQLEDGRQQLNDAREEIEQRWQEVEDGKEELAEGKQTLTDSAQALEEARTQIEEGEKAYQEGYDLISQKQQEADNGKNSIEDGWEQYNQGAAALEEARTQIEEGEKEYQEGYDLISQKQQEADSAQKAIDEGWEQYNQGAAVLEETKKQIEAGEGELAAGEEQLAQAQAAFEEESDSFNYMKASADTLAPDLTTYQDTMEDYSNLSQGGNLSEDEQKELASLTAFLDEFNSLLGQALGLGDLDADDSQTVIDKIVELAAENGKEHDVFLQCKGEAIAAAQKELDAAKEELDANRTLLDEKRKELEEGRKTLDENQQKLEETANTLTQSEETLAEGKAQLEAGWKELEDSKAQLDAAKQQLTQSEQQLETVRQQLIDGEKSLEDGNAQLAAGWGELADSRVQLDEAKTQLAQGEQELADGWNTINEKEQELADGEAQLNQAEEEIEKNEQDLIQSEQELADARQELADGEQDYQEALAEYEDQAADAEQEIADAQEEISNAQEEIDQMETPEWYILDRQSIQTYVEYDMDADRIGAIGRVFPAIFFLVAALVSLTTMTRMVEEERTQIGTMKALGYSKKSIASKYIWYALLATLAGGVLGVIVGGIFLPYVIIRAYSILYTNLSTMVIPIRLGLSVQAVLIAVLCTVVATMSSCAKELAAVPAQLMRPAAPKQGKRVFLERIPFIWNRMKFTSKSTVRNLFRYKKRFFMTVFGIGGCMALLMVGFGLRDSIQAIVDNQYTNLWTYDAYMSIDEEKTTEEKLALAQEVKESESFIEEELLTYAMAMEATANGVTKDINLFVPETTENLSDFIVFKSRTTDESYTLPQDGVIISEKLARLLELEVGDVITIKESETESYEAPVRAITENYLYHYIYMTPEYYETLTGQAPKYNQICIKTQDLTSEQEGEMFGRLLDNEDIISVTSVEELETQVHNMMQSLDQVIWVLIVSAGLLAYVVLYNLNNINITERRRELATLKVLGFYNIEVTEYVYRENVILTLFGIVAGIFMGIILHQFVIQTCEIDMIMFGRRIEPLSYLFSVIMTILFAFIVNVSMYYKLKKIDMVESLKSVE